MAIYSSIGFDLDDKRYFHLASELTASQTNDRSRVLANIAVALNKRCELLHNPLDTCHRAIPCASPRTIWYASWCSPIRRRSCR
jgi:hypothetical protein